MDKLNSGKTNMKKGQIITMPPDKAAEHGDKLKLVDMKKSLYRVETPFTVKVKKVRNARKNADKE